MATEKTNADAIGLYLSGASTDAGAQGDPAAALGGFRSGTPVEPFGVYVENPIAPVRVDAVTGACGLGAATITRVDATTLRLTGPGDTAGADVTVAEGGTYLLESNDTDMAARVTWETGYDDELPIGSMTLNLLRQVNDALGMGNVSNADRAAGVDRYRGLFMRAHGANNVTLLKVWIEPITAAETTNNAQLSGTGAGTIETSGDFDDFSDQGWAAIFDNGGTLREIVYYTKTNSTTLAVAAAHRGRLGTSAAAGANDDTIRQVPGIRLAKETPGGDGSIQTIADENTAPTAVTWVTGYDSSTGVDIGSVNAGDDAGLWIHHEIPAGATVDVLAENAIGFSFTEGGNSYTQTHRGYYRVADSSLALYELNAGTDAEPDLTAAADASNATLPFTFALTPPGAGDREYRYVVRQRNAYGLIGLNTKSRGTTIDNLGAEVTEGPTAPTGTALADVTGGTLRLRASYQHANDAGAEADYFRYYLRGDGQDPDAGADTPVAVAVAPHPNFPGVGKILNTTVGPFAVGADVRVLVRSYRSSDGLESDNTTPVTLTVGSQHPDRLAATRALGGERLGLARPSGALSETVYISQPNNVRWILSPGVSTLWWGATLVFRIIKRTNTANNGFWTTFAHVNDTISGAAGQEPVEYVDANTGYISVNGTRRLKIDVANSRLQFPTHLGIYTNFTGNASLPAADYTWHTLLQVPNELTLNYETAGSLDTSGVLRLGVPWKHAATVGDIPD